MDNILEVKKLKVSFRTGNGTVKAVRNISFNLERGKTLAIVGESGSGKSVTSKAILAILAGNSIIEGGEIYYNGRDLLRTSEEEMCKLRGTKISMIFQDPLSALNPIVKIGKQLTEAMLLKNKTDIKTARAEFNRTLELLKDAMIGANAADETKIKSMTETFDKFCIEAVKLENSYNQAREEAKELVAQIGDFVFEVEKNQEVFAKEILKDFERRLKLLKDYFLTAGKDEIIAGFASDMSVAAGTVKTSKKVPGTSIPSEVISKLKEIEALCKELCEFPRPNFFRIGYYKLKHPEENLAGSDIEELNEKALLYLNSDFMLEFASLAAKGLQYSYKQKIEKKKALLPKLSEAKAYYSGEYTEKEAMHYATELGKLVSESINDLDVQKDSLAYSFTMGMHASIAKYFGAIKSNPKEEARFEKQSAKRQALIEKGKEVTWKVVPKTVYDLSELKSEIVHLLEELERNYKAYIEKDTNGSVDFDADTIKTIDHLRDLASEVVDVVTPGRAKERAIKLMKEVGISEPRMRYNQYPFEFSGGMRQRIVIAIALAANPDILICDEPTTALDVTIQAQILELINKLKEERNLSVIFITHDLGVVANMADDIAVMYAGKIVEQGSVDDIFYNPRHPYTWALLSSMPDLDTNETLDAIPGTPPNMIYPPKGDAFADRNKYAMQIDFEEEPPMFEVSPGHYAATWLLHPDAPKVDIPEGIKKRIERMKAREEGENV